MNFQELKSALPDALAMRSGIDVKGAHPLADNVAETPLQEICKQIGEHIIATDPRGIAARHPRAAFAAGLTSQDFGVAVAAGLQKLMVRRYDSLADHLPLCAPVVVTNFRRIDLPMLDVGPGLPEVGENGEISHNGLVSTATGQSGQLTSYARLLRISRETFINDLWGAVSTALTGLAASASRLENKLVFDLLETNPALSDGELLFHADLLTEVSGALSDATIGTAMGMLRSQKSATGEPAGFGAAYLAVDPYLEAKALKLVHDMGANLQVIASPNIASGRWYLFADPESAPVVGRLTLSSARAPVRVERKKPPVQFDGIGVQVGTDVGFMVIDRLGVVRGVA